MASNCVKPSTGLLHLAVWCLLCLDITTAGLESMVICDIGPCGVGERFDPTTSACSPCHHGSFMDRQNHTCLQCIPCIEPDQLEHELVFRNCTATSDTEIGCDSFHYRTMLDDLQEPYCERCTECDQDERVKQACGPDSDTVCVNHEVDTTHDKGSFLNVSGNRPQLVDNNSSTNKIDINSSRIDSDNAFANKRGWLPLLVVLIVIIVGSAPIIIIMLVYKQSLRSICKTLPKLPNCRMKKNARDSQIIILQDFLL